MSEQVGVSIATYNRFEQGIYKSNPLTVAKVKDFLKKNEKKEEQDMKKVSTKTIIIAAIITVIVGIGLYFILDYNINGSPADKKAAEEQRLKTEETRKQYEEYQNFLKEQEDKLNGK